MPTPDHHVAHHVPSAALRLVLATALALFGLGVVAAAPASADPPALPETVSADALPTWQINGVVWSQVIVGNTVYVTGSFTRARPPGVALGGAGEVDANNIFAYDVTTGNRVAGFDHSLNAQGLVVRAAPDGSRIYVGGDFTSVDGLPRGHVAAFDTATGSLLTTFAPNTDGQVRAFVITPSTVYVGGNFRSASGQARGLLAAFNPGNGAITAWAPQADGGYVWDMVMSPDQSRVIIAGSFTTLNGLDAYGMGALDAATGVNLAWAATSQIRSAGLNGAIVSLSTDGAQIFGTGYDFGAGASFEGTFAADPGTGSLNWVQDCLGDTYDSWPMNGVLYTVSHNHDCSVVNGFSDTNPRSRWQKAGAMPTFGTGTITRKDAYGWDFTGLRYPGVLQWFPDLEFGSYTDARQAAWSVTGNGDYLVLGGEFPVVNGTAQQGLVRFAKRSIAPNKMGPIFNNGATPTPVPTDSGTVKVIFTSMWDRDDKTLTYDIFRNSGPKIATMTRDSNFWTLPTQTYIDTGLTPGSQVRYQVRATDPKGNVQWSAWTGYVTVGSAAPSAYASLVKQDGATHQWRLAEAAGSTMIVDDVGDHHGTNSGMTLGAAGAITSETGTAATAAANTAKITTRDSSTGPQSFTVEGWVKTTSLRGGRILGFGNNSTTTSSTGLTDRVLYLDNTGHPNFMVYSGAVRAVAGRNAINDGQWHYLVGTLSPSAGMELFVDGQRVGRDQRYVNARDYDGYWRIGADSVRGFTTAPSDTGLVGSLAELAVYPQALTAATVKAHYLASGRTQTWPNPPADTYGQAVTADNPDSFWRLGTVGSTVADAAGNGRLGTVTGSVTGGQAAVPGDPAAAFTTNGLVVDQYGWNAPQAFTTELWFKTTTTKGGKLAGFGNATSGLSTTYDRHVWMLNTGAIAFGVTSGSQVVLTSPGTYNDGQWHHVVASQDNSGMKLWLDTVLVRSNTTTTAQAYNGHWRVGGDRVWSGSTNSYFTGTLDEVAIYPRALPESSLRAHYLASGRNLGTATGPTPKVSDTTPTVDQTLSAVTGIWAPSNVQFAYQWYRDTTVVPSATAASYTVRPADAGHTLKVEVTGNCPGTDAFCGGYASASKTSTVTARVARARITPAPAPVLDTTAPVVDKLITATFAPAWGPDPIALTYQWYKVKSSRKEYAIANAKASTFKPTGAEVGYKLKLKVTGTKAGYATKSVYSSLTGKVVKASFASVADPTITGSVKVGMPLTAVPGTSDPAASYSYQWYRGTTAISGATASTYKTTSSDLGKQLKVKVTYKRLGYSSVVRYSPYAGVIEPGLAGVTPKLNDTTPVVGQVLGITDATAIGAWTPSDVTPAYQWYRGTTAIPGATSATYEVQAADVGKAISVKVIGSKDGYVSVTKAAAASSLVAEGTFTTKPVPTFVEPVDDLHVGGTLTVVTDGWVPEPTSFTYAWYRSGVLIPGQPGASYTLVGADAAKLITVKVTAVRSGFTSASTTSTPTGAILP